MKKFIQFLKEARLELKKVSWPPRHELIGSTTLVIVVSVLAGLLLGVLDIVFFRSVYGLINVFGGM
ncbi:preprotein translocase subunit SecE [candidate division KSB3 bacterium]|uniref:Protein translocase subunit SecE n=1 Tax=candidate division KSB3 bacterium TaxID=2044937 RepID=A0A2G6E154_9BACT|nr:MAG: preprotein translocase subunit SecE [candidate division KSB3 bacterium]PIE31046.1 MAG: preprotein translocase subunit SecE [candidate division KSB3 bacterium]